MCWCYTILPSRVALILVEVHPVEEAHVVGLAQNTPSYILLQVRT